MFTQFDAMEEVAVPEVSTTDQSEERVLAIVMHATFYVLLGASLARFLIRHPGSPQSGWVLALSGLLALLYVAGAARRGGGGGGGAAGRRHRGRTEIGSRAHPRTMVECTRSTTDSCTS
ncbi:hypothetical protein [Nocardia cyriacigeorgica]|uniref:hypothetical protein n=1 Tax=Nocardia cyriacigeorgica TaxID=135487 RepID=UPI002455E899|nr:hypothetical protein [Nocardia cyriacigeorgica]